MKTPLTVVRMAKKVAVVHNVAQAVVLEIFNQEID